MSTATHDPIQLRGLTVTFLQDEADTDGAATVFEVRVPVGAFTPPAHRHDGFDEVFYVTEGMFTFIVDDEVHEFRAGQTGFIKRGQVHRFDNTGAVDGAFLTVATPGVFGPRYFQELAAVLDASPDGPPNLDALFGVMSRHGLTPVMPNAPTSVG